MSAMSTIATFHLFVAIPKKLSFFTFYKPNIAVLVIIGGVQVK